MSRRRLEIAAQVEDGSLPEPAHAVVPVGTGGTAAGLALGFQLAGLRTRVVGVVVNDSSASTAGRSPASRGAAPRCSSAAERASARSGSSRTCSS